MNKRVGIVRGLRVTLLVTLCSLVASCDDPQIYGSVGYSSWGGGGFGTSVSIGGRIR